MRYTLKELARELQLQVHGDDRVEISKVASITSAESVDLVFATDEATLAAADRSSAAAVIAPHPAQRKPTLIAPEAKLAFARAARLLADPVPSGLGVHPSAIVGKNVVLGLGVSVGPHCTIDDNVSISSRSRISAGCRIGTSVTIGEQCVLHANVTVYPQTRIGARAIIHSGTVLGSDGFGFVRDPGTGKYEKFPQQGTLEIGNDVEIGANCTIDRGALAATVISDSVKMDNMVHIGHNVRIGRNVVIAAQTGISGSSVIEDNVVVAGQVGIADHVTIKSGAVLGAQSGVPTGKIIAGGEVYWGTPARPLQRYLKELATLARLTKKDR